MASHESDPSGRTSSTQVLTRDVDFGSSSSSSFSVKHQTSTSSMTVNQPLSPTEHGNRFIHDSQPPTVIPSVPLTPATYPPWASMPKPLQASDVEGSDSGSCEPDTDSETDSHDELSSGREDSTESSSGDSVVEGAKGVGPETNKKPDPTPNHEIKVIGKEEETVKMKEVRLETSRGMDSDKKPDPTPGHENEVIDKGGKTAKTNRNPDADQNDLIKKSQQKPTAKPKSPIPGVSPSDNVMSGADSDNSTSHKLISEVQKEHNKTMFETYSTLPKDMQKAYRFLCPICHSNTGRSDALQRHLRGCHSMVIAPEAKKARYFSYPLQETNLVSCNDSAWKQRQTLARAEQRKRTRSNNPTVSDNEDKESTKVKTKGLEKKIQSWLFQTFHQPRMLIRRPI